MIIGPKTLTIEMRLLCGGEQRSALPWRMVGVTGTLVVSVPSIPITVIHISHFYLNKKGNKVFLKKSEN